MAQQEQECVRRDAGSAVSCVFRDSLVEALIAHRSMLIGVARGVVGCRAHAEDVVHDVLIKLIQLPAQGAIARPLAYVTQMVRNASIDNLRRQTLESLYRAADDEGLDVPAPQPTPEAALMTRDALQHTCDALGQLPERTQAAFELVRLREQTLQDAARALQVSQTLVHFMVRNAVQHCADYLDAVDTPGRAEPPSRPRRKSRAAALAG